MGEEKTGIEPLVIDQAAALIGRLEIEIMRLNILLADRLAYIAQLEAKIPDSDEK